MMKLFTRVVDALLWIPITLVSIIVRPRQQYWAILLESHQPFEGNVRTLAYYLLQNHPVSLFIVNYRRDQPNLAGWSIAPEVVPGRSWREVWVRLIARQVVYTHGKNELMGRFSGLTGIRFINVFHGIPLKGMGNLMPTFPRRKLLKQYREGKALHAFCVSSGLERTSFAAAYLYDANRIFITGSPRNDILLKEEKRDPRQQQIFEQIREQLDGKKMVLYAPTFRDYDRMALGFTRRDIEHLAAVLRENNACLAIRPHPRDVDLYEPLIAGIDGVLMANSGRWEDTNSVLAATDVLISDYSSIALDYLLLDRPVIGYMWDYERYMNRRGFMFDFVAIFPAPITYTSTELVAQLKVSAQNQWQIDAQHQRQHNSVKRLFHSHTDGQACERIWQRAMTP